MKKIFYSIFLFITVVSSSCSDQFLDVPVQGGPTTSSDPKLAERLVTGVYNSMLQGDSWGNGDVHGFAFLTVTSIISDDADKGSTAGDQQIPVGDIDNFTLTPSNRFAETLWSGHYKAIGAANKALEALETASISEEEKNKLKGEVRFLRGYFYFNLVRMYGGVPLVLRVPRDAADANSDLAFQTRATEEQVYTSIKSDLTFAYENLKVKSQSLVGHANKGAAGALLAKVHMYLKEWQPAFDLTKEIIESNQYQLVEDYATIWRQAGDNSSESIFEIQTGEFNNANLNINNYTTAQGVRVGGKGGWDDLGWGFNNPSTSLIAAYEPDDLRKNATIIFVDNSGEHHGTILWDGFRIPSSDSVQNLYYNYKAYASNSKENYADPGTKDLPKNIKILRYAEVLLINAEAGLELGQGDPTARVNEVRERAGLDDLGSVDIDDVWQERRIEFAMEHDRFWDLVRQGRAAEVMQAAGKNFVAGKHERLPIPISQILLSGNKLKQNDQY
ncbi:RagB/SusD family nutrient uptake outer membrane protein [Pseudochryseolinea flava]|uniref:RagB/SusD family nutrient uptake outer membrane protein n=1 Tax=Pseudochryseolinea flava TaxID=2059302 RepID=A0A364Y2Y2_9BACT|nr:RagB/SusD family nutrient uptake outer membrane protein [Pseudochryseolinea flava]RAW00672.1 RagB/SusD family nutrient uptake outer membrane protein [Pseudochryseolinea flava]